MTATKTGFDTLSLLDEARACVGFGVSTMAERIRVEGAEYLKYVAVHEAGHAVASVVRRQHFDHVTIEPCEGGEGHVAFRAKTSSVFMAYREQQDGSFVQVLVGRERRRLFDRAVMFRAGRAAETLDGDNLLYLEEAKEQGEARIGAFDASATALLAKMDAVTRSLRTERRKADATSSQRLAIDAKLGRLDAMCDELANEMRRRAAGIRSETDALEADILAALRGEGELEHRTTVRWRCLPRRWGCPVRLDVHQREAEMWSLVVRDKSTLVNGWWR